MRRSLIAVAGGALLATTAVSTAFAADIYVPEPEVLVEPAPVSYEPVPVADNAFGGWYIRGDVIYGAHNEMGDITYRTSDGENDFSYTDLDESWGVGGAIGVNVHKHLRTEFGVDWYKKYDFRGSTTGFCGPTGTTPCESDDRTEVSILTLMANAYVDLGTYYGFTAYVGGGIGGARVEWETLFNDDGFEVTPHDGYKEWRFAWQLMAGASYCLTEELEADIGYRYREIEGGRMFAFNTFNGPGYDEGIKSHEVRAGLRYNFGGANPRCATYVPPAPPLPPAPPPVYK
ncbi:outer membrane protein [Notoacmeibacter ruber]|uniref:Porin family protein n=1 Tax=Notoacmeibacter ruber TaxID=2670375 RepID=A0A3L7JDZ1_9HYPH|nr:outer membrane protein [Notoacmeibacter ruber]RLQ88674.1 porin family protein [Notoacmeibacter ruber]